MISSILRFSYLYSLLPEFAVQHDEQNSRKVKPSFGRDVDILSLVGQASFDELGCLDDMIL